jgi:hypothetical protein
LIGQHDSADKDFDIPNPVSYSDCEDPDPSQCHKK